MLASMGKDSAVMVQLARRAFYPAVPPLPLLLLDTAWRCCAMDAPRDHMVRESGMQLIVHRNPEAAARRRGLVCHASLLANHGVMCQAHPLYFLMPETSRFLGGVIAMH